MKRVLIATVVALAAATAAFFTLVLPAEFGVDPTGAGRLLGLTGLAGEPETDVHRTALALVGDQREFELAPFESVELKYDLATGDGMVYSWKATGEVVFDLHAEPADAPEGVASSFAQGRTTADNGTYVAAFDGVHGWFWENRGYSSVVVTLRAIGFIGGAILYADGRSERVPLTD